MARNTQEGEDEMGSLFIKQIGNLSTGRNTSICTEKRTSCLQCNSNIGLSAAKTQGLAGTQENTWTGEK
eukprot:1669691-Heterocapsa_arctica.AAC.1